MCAAEKADANVPQAFQPANEDSAQPEKAEVHQLTRRFRFILLFFIAALVASGLTAIPLRWELDVLASLFGIDPQTDPATLTGLSHWIATVRNGLDATYGSYPFMAYGTDWLAFAHVIIAVFFLGPLIKPGSNDWVLVAGMIACVLVIPFALLMGGLRGIPVGWRWIDCSFGFFGFFPLLYCWFLGRRISRMSPGA